MTNPFADLIPEKNRTTDGLATTFGYNDREDNGIGAWGAKTNNPDIMGASLPRKMIRDHFGNEDDANGAFVEVLNPESGKRVVVPLVDKGPADWVVDRQGPTVDLTHAANQAIGGTGRTPVQFRIIGKDPFADLVPDGGMPSPPAGEMGGGDDDTASNPFADLIPKSGDLPTATPRIADDLGLKAWRDPQGGEEVRKAGLVKLPARADRNPESPAQQSDWADAAKAFAGGIADSAMQVPQGIFTQAGEGIENQKALMLPASDQLKLESLYAEKARYGKAAMDARMEMREDEFALADLKRVNDEIRNIEGEASRLLEASPVSGARDEFRRLSDELGGIRKEYSEFYNVDDDFQKSFGGKLIQAAGAFVPQILAGSLGPTGLVALQSQAFQNAWDDAKQTAERNGEAFNPEKAYAYAFTDSLQQALLEKAGAESALAGWLEKGGAMTLKEGLKRFATGFAGEGGTEGVQGAVSDTLAGVFGIEQRNPLDLQRRFDDVAIGGILGGGVAGAGSASQAFVENRQSQFSKKINAEAAGIKPRAEKPQTFTNLADIPNINENQTPPQQQGAPADSQRDNSEASSADSSGIEDSLRADIAENPTTDAELEAMMREYQQEQQDLYDESQKSISSEELLDAVIAGGGLPSSESEYHGAWSGELERIRESIRAQGKGGVVAANKGMVVSKLMRKDAPAPDRLVQTLKAKGFPVDTVSDLFDVVDDRLMNGRKVYSTRTPEAAYEARYAKKDEGGLFAENDMPFNLQGEVDDSAMRQALLDEKSKADEAKRKAEGEQGVLFAQKPFTQEERQGTPEKAENWLNIVNSVAPGAAKRLGLVISSRQEAEQMMTDIETELSGKPSGVTIPDTAHAAIHRNVVYLFNEALGSYQNQRGEGLRRIQHEIGHAWWDTLGTREQEALTALWKAETSAKVGSLYTEDGQTKPEVMDGVESDVQEWLGEKIAEDNARWAEGKARATEHNGGRVSKIAAKLRGFLFDARQALFPDKSRSVIANEFRKVLKRGKGSTGGREIGGGQSGVRLASAGNEDDLRYLELAKDPEANKAELQRMVDEAAKAAGYNVGPVWHRTYEDFFEVFNTDGGGSMSSSFLGAFFTPSKEYADIAYAPEKFGGRGIKAFLRIRNPFVLSYGEAWDLTDEKAIALRKRLETDGYDGVDIPNKVTPEIAVFSPSQIKSADPVTYDAQGNVIPLSQRFNPESNDIRFAAGKPVPSTEQSRQLFGEWAASLKDDDVLYGYRGEAGPASSGNGFGNTEGVGLYVAKDRKTAEFFGDARKVAFPQPKNPLLIDEDSGADTLPLMREEDEDLWNDIFSYEEKPGDSDWIKAHKRAAKKIRLTSESWGDKMESFTRALTDEILAMGYDSTYTKSGGEEWVAILAKPGEWLKRGTQTKRGETLYASGKAIPSTGPQVRPIIQMPVSVVKGLTGQTYRDWSNPAPGIARLWRGTADVFEKTPGLEFLGQAIRRHVDTARKYQGQMMAPFRKWHMETKASDRRQALKEFEGYFQEQERNPVLAAQVYRLGSQAGRNLIDLWKDAADKTGDINKANNMQVFDGELGTWRPIGRVSNYFPRMIKEDVMKILANPQKNPTGRDELIREMIAEGIVSTEDQANQMVNQAAQSYAANDHFNAIEKARSTRLPTMAYDYSFATARKYLMAWGERMGQVEAFGQKVGNQGKDLFDKAQELTFDEPTKKYIKSVQDRAYGARLDNAAGRLANTANQLATGLQLGNPLSTIKNLLSGMTMAGAFYGTRRALGSFLDVRNAFDKIDDAYEKGIILDDLMNMLEDRGMSQSKVTGFANFMLSASGFNAAETWVRVVNMGAAQSFLRHAIKSNLKNPGSRASLQYRGFIARLGINQVQALLDEGGAGPLTDSFLRRAVNEVQGGYRYDQVPAFMDSPAGRFFFKYQKWGSQQMRAFIRHIVNPFLTGVSLGTVGKTELVRYRDPKTGNVVTKKVPGAVMPAFRYLLILALAGAGTEELLNLLFGRPEMEASWAEIAIAMDKDRKEAFGMALNKLWLYHVMAGSMGNISNYLQMGMDIANRSRFKNPMDPPSLAVIKSAVDLGLDWNQQGKVTMTDIDKFLRSSLSAYRTGKDFSATQLNRAGAEFKWAKLNASRQDATWMRMQTDRFNETIGSKRALTQISRVGKTDQTPFRNGLKEDLRVGDIQGARKRLNEWLASVPADRRKDSIMSLAESVQASQPIRAGSGSGVMRGAFLQWARQNLPKESVMRIQKIDKTYRESAIAIGLMKPNEPDNSDIAKALMKYGK